LFKSSKSFFVGTVIFLNVPRQHAVSILLFGGEVEKGSGKSEGSRNDDIEAQTQRRQIDQVKEDKY
jgi:hypothetical protein